MKTATSDPSPDAVEVTKTAPNPEDGFPHDPTREKPKKADAVKRRAVPLPGNDGLWGALLEAQRECNEVEKDAENRYHGYRYASAEAIIREARRATNIAGLVLFRSSWWYSRDDFDLGPDVRLIVFSCEIRHPASGESFSAEIIYPAMLHDGHPWDKATSAALTTAWAYWLRDLLQIPRVDESVDNRDDRSFDPKKARGADPVPEPKDPQRKATNAVGVQGEPEPRRVPQPAASSGSARMEEVFVGSIPDEYWAHKNAGRGGEIAALLPQPDARAMKIDGKWGFYVKRRKQAAGEVVREEPAAPPAGDRRLTPEEIDQIPIRPEATPEQVKKEQEEQATALFDGPGPRRTAKHVKNLAAETAPPPGDPGEKAVADIGFIIQKVAGLAEDQATRVARWWIETRTNWTVVELSERAVSTEAWSLAATQPWADLLLDFKEESDD